MVVGREVPDVEEYRARMRAIEERLFTYHTFEDMQEFYWLGLLSHEQAELLDQYEALSFVVDEDD